MKHNAVDLKAQIDRASLPLHLTGFLFPVFEAVSNAIHSVEDRFSDKVVSNGKIEVEFHRSQRLIVVRDNGEGFTKKNLEAFLTPLTGNKLSRNGKGFGRFIAIKVFDSIIYSSFVESGKGNGSIRDFKYDPLDAEDNLQETTIASSDRHVFDRGVTVRFFEPKEQFSHYFKPRESEVVGVDDSEIADAIADHFLVEFLNGKLPNHFVLRFEEKIVDLTAQFNIAIKSTAKDEVTLLVGQGEQTFRFSFLQVAADYRRKHTLYFFSDSRAASEPENISKGVSDRPFENEQGERYNYLVTVESSFFTSSQSRDKIENLQQKIDQSGSVKVLKDVLVSIARRKILEIEPEYTAKQRASIRKNVEELIALDPVLRRGLDNKSLDDFVAERNITETKEQLAQDLFIARMRSKFDFRKINAKTPLSELQRVVQTKITEDAKEALAVYVAYRNDVIRIMKEMLGRTDSGLAKEDAVHQLIYPRYRDSEEVNYPAHNLWLIDDDLAFAEYISSDRTVSGKYRAEGQFAHDLLVNNQDELLIVEMKRPQKTSYVLSDDGKPTDNPVQQLIAQVGQMRDRGSITTSSGRNLSIAENKMIRGYIIADWNDELRTYLADNDFITTDFGGPMAYKYYTKRNLMVELLAFNRLADRAHKRNQVFAEILSGNADGLGKRLNKLGILSPGDE